MEQIANAFVVCPDKRTGAYPMPNLAINHELQAQVTIISRNLPVERKNSSPFFGLIARLAYLWWGMDVVRIERMMCLSVKRWCSTTTIPIRSRTSFQPTYVLSEPRFRCRNCNSFSVQGYSALYTPAARWHGFYGIITNP